MRRTSLEDGVGPIFASTLRRSHDTHGKANATVILALQICACLLVACLIFAVGFLLGACTRVAVDRRAAIRQQQQQRRRKKNHTGRNKGLPTSPCE